MHRFYLPKEQCRGDLFQLTGPEAWHARKVLRLGPGDEASILDGEGTIVDCRIQAISGDTVTLTVHERTVVPPLPYRMTLLQAIPKGKIIESIIQKATELGAARVVPLITERVVSQVDEDSGAKKVRKWQQIAIEAMKQSGAPWLPIIEPPLSLPAWLDRREQFEMPLAGSLHGGARHAHDYFETFHGRELRPPKTACVWIGPEGDFTPAEMAAIQQTALPITLGRQILRSETAAIYGLSILHHELEFWWAKTSVPKQ